MAKAKEDRSATRVYVNRDGVETTQVTPDAHKVRWTFKSGNVYEADPMSYDEDIRHQLLFFGLTEKTTNFMASSKSAAASAGRPQHEVAEEMLVDGLDQLADGDWARAGAGGPPLSQLTEAVARWLTSKGQDVDEERRGRIRQSLKNTEQYERATATAGIMAHLADVRAEASAARAEAAHAKAATTREDEGTLGF